MTWQDMLMVAGAVGTIVAAIKGVQYLFSLTPTSKLQSQVEKHEERLAKDKTRLDDHEVHLQKIDIQVKQNDEKIDKMSAEIRSSINTLGMALASLINHEIDGNDTKKLTEVRDELFKKFIER